MCARGSLDSQEEFLTQRRNGATKLKVLAAPLRENVNEPIHETYRLSGTVGPRQR